MIICLGVTTDLHTGERAKTYYLEGRIMYPSVTTDLHTGERAKTDYLEGRIMCPSVATDLDRRKSKDWLSRRYDNISGCNN
jgi:hypothetical protein